MFIKIQYDLNAISIATNIRHAKMQAIYWESSFFNLKSAPFVVTKLITGKSFNFNQFVHLLFSAF